MTNSSKKPSRKSVKKKYRSLFWGAGIGTAIVFSVLAIAFIILLNRKEPEESAPLPAAPPIEEEAAKPAASENPQVSEEEPVDYPMPEYNFMLEEIYVPIEGLEKEYTLAWVSDLHLIPEKDSNISPASTIKLKSRYDTLSVTAEGIHAEDLWPEVVKCLNYGNYDALIFGGDMMDYCSEDNMKLFKAGYDSLRYKKEQILYIRADHDYGDWHVGDKFTRRDIYDLHEELDGDDPEEKCLDMGEFILIGVNSSTKNITDENFSIVKDQYKKAAEENKPVIAVTHVPYGSNVDDSLKELSMKVRNKPYYWVGPDYQPNDTMWDYLDLIFREDTQVKQVLAGHLHAPWDGQITDQLREHIFSPAFSGVIGVIHVVPAGTEKENNSHRLRPEEEMPEDENKEEMLEETSKPAQEPTAPAPSAPSTDPGAAVTPPTPGATTPGAATTTPGAAAPPATDTATPGAATPPTTDTTTPGTVTPPATDTTTPGTVTPADPGAQPPAGSAAPPADSGTQPPADTPPATDAQPSAADAAQTPSA